MDEKDARGWPVRRNESGARVCARRMCREAEYRINGYCSGYCEDVDAIEQGAEEEIATLRAVAEWYAERARSLQRYGEEPVNATAIEAVVSELMIDGGARLAALGRV